MKNYSSLIKGGLKWSAIILMLAGIVAYFSVEYFLQSSYKNMATGQYQQAVLNSSQAMEIANWLYSGSSKHLQDIQMYNIKVCSKAGIMGLSFGEGAKNFTLNNILKFEVEHDGGLIPEDLAKMRIEGARIANATTHGQGVDALVGRIINKTLPSNPTLTAYAQEESAYHDVVGFFATLKPKDMKDKKLNDSVIEWANKDHNAAQETICKTDVERCRFNQLRWQIGLCIRRAYLNEVPVCKPEVLKEVTFFPITCGKELTVDQCYTVMDDLLPHYLHLLQAQGNMN